MAGEEPNALMEALPVEVETLEPDLEEHRSGETVAITAAWRCPT